jgi:hypothetical protein
MASAPPRGAGGLGPGEPGWSTARAGPAEVGACWQAVDTRPAKALPSNTELGLARSQVEQPAVQPAATAPEDPDRPPAGEEQTIAIQLPARMQRRRRQLNPKATPAPIKSRGPGTALAPAVNEVGAFYRTVPTPDIVNSGREEQGSSRHRPHGEFCLPGSCAVLHGITSIKSGPD